MKRILVLLLAGTIAASCIITGCASKSGNNSDSAGAASFVGKYADNPYYEKSVALLKKDVGLTDQQADDAFGVLLDCGFVTKEISNIFKNVDMKTGELSNYNVWIDLVQYGVFFDENGKITKITDGFEKVFYENGKKIAESTTSAEPTTAKPTQQPTTAKPTQQPTTEKPTEAATPIVITEYTNVVEAGSNAHVTIQGAPNIEYTIHVFYDSGESKAAGLENKVADENGNVTWEWEVGSKTTPGTHSFTVTGGGATETVKFEVK